MQDPVGIIQATVIGEQALSLHLVLLVEVATRVWSTSVAVMVSFNNYTFPKFAGGVGIGHCLRVDFAYDLERAYELGV